MSKRIPGGCDYVVAWSIAVALIAAVAAPALWSGYRESRAPGIVDVGVPGVTLPADSRASTADDGIPLQDRADHLYRDNNRQRTVPVDAPMVDHPAM